MVPENEEFGKQNPYFGYLVASLNGQVVGYALYCYVYSTWEGKSMQLQEFHVSPNTKYSEDMKKDLLRSLAKVRQLKKIFFHYLFNISLSILIHSPHRKLWMKIAPE